MLRSPDHPIYRQVLTLSSAMTFELERNLFKYVIHAFRTLIVLHSKGSVLFQMSSYSQLLLIKDYVSKQPIIVF
jgi:hypothetical protein